MVAVIHASKSIRNALHYNEQKTNLIIDQKSNKKAAELIQAKGFAKDPEQLGFADKLKTFQKLMERNDRVKVNSLHISLNFAPGESHLTNEKLRQIAASYMEKIGFGNQPYLVYRHHDSGHPHIHLITTNIQSNGVRIPLHNIGKDRSEKARIAIEKEFGLVQADQRQRLQAFAIKPIDAKKVTYGPDSIAGTKRAITNVLDSIIPKYRYTSLPELNAVLRRYNVAADPGGKDSRIARNGGLVFRVLDAGGQKVGVPIPASHFYNKPILKNLKVRFQENEVVRQKHKLRTKNAIDMVFIRYPGITVSQLVAALQKENIELIIRQNEKGIIYGLTYVDHQTKCVFNGSDLGKSYSANQIQQRCVHQLTSEPNRSTLSITESQHNLNISLTDIVAAALQPEYESAPAMELRDERKKKRRRKIRH